MDLYLHWVVLQAILDKKEKQKQKLREHRHGYRIVDETKEAEPGQDQDDTKDGIMSVSSRSSKMVNEHRITSIRGFSVFDKEKWMVSEDGLVIEGTDDIGLGPWFIYAEGDLNGYCEGIHVWSIKCVSGSTECEYKGIGVISERNEDWTTYECDKWGLIGFGVSYSYYDGIWDDNEILTVLLDCDKWVCRYYKNGKEIKIQKIKSNKSYYFGFCSFGYQGYQIKYECVHTPQQIINENDNLLKC